MAQPCPKCGLINPPSTEVCDCGYRFVLAQHPNRNTPGAQMEQVAIAPPKHYKFCPHCGTEFVSTAQYCFSCGSARPGIEPATAPQTVSGFALSVSGHVSFQRNRGPACERCKEPIRDLRTAFEVTPPGKPTILLCQECGEALREQSQLSQVIQIDHKPSQCHHCGNRSMLRRFPFGMAKELSTKRDWSRPFKTAAKLAAINLVAVPLGGAVFSYGGWKPGKTTSFRVLRAELVLCERCTNRVKGFFGRIKLSAEDYARHPWAPAAGRLGFTTFLTEEELSRLRPEH